MPTDNDTEILLREIIGYFTQAGGDQKSNVTLAKPIIYRWGSLSVAAALGFIVSDIQSMPNATVPLSFQMSGDTLDRIVVGTLMNKMALMHDFMKACGSNAHNWLMDAVMQFHEDVRALAAYILADDKYVSLDSRARLKNAYSFTVGTSCQMALALALFMVNERTYLRSFIDQGYFGSTERYQTLRQIANQSEIKYSEDDLEMIAVLMMVVPEVSLGTPESAVLIKILALDIESNGKAMEHIQNWKRKQ